MSFRFLISWGKEFQRIGPIKRRLFLPKVTFSTLTDFKLLQNLLELLLVDLLKISFIKGGFRSFKVLKISKINNLSRLISNLTSKRSSFRFIKLYALAVNFSSFPFDFANKSATLEDSMRN